MQDTAVWDWGGLVGLFIAICALPGSVIYVFWRQYKNRKHELGATNYTFKDYIKWLYEGIWGDLWSFLKVVILIAVVIAGIALVIAAIYLVFVAISSGIEQISVKGVLVIIAILLVLILLKQK